MSKVICYSLFGVDRPRAENCDNFNSYLRGLMLNIRLKRLLFSDWEIYLQTDQATYDKWGKLFEQLGIKIEVHQNNVPLTLAMLWRLRPIFEFEGGFPKWSYVICRDVEAPLTYRDRQAVQYWIDHERAAHAITDSVSHTIPMLGGMIGFKPRDFYDTVGARTWSELISKKQYDWPRKGSDQSFINEIIYPKFSQPGKDSITQHYFFGMPNTFLGDYKTCQCWQPGGHVPHCVNDVELPLHHDLRESDSIAGHIGAFGWYDPQMYKFLRKFKDQFTDLIEIEKEWPDVFGWTKDTTFE